MIDHELVQKPPLLNDVEMQAIFWFPCPIRNFNAAVHGNNNYFNILQNCTMQKKSQNVLTKFSGQSHKIKFKFRRFVNLTLFSFFSLVSKHAQRV
jgi:hypothetical protein